MIGCVISGDLCLKLGHVISKNLDSQMNELKIHTKLLYSSKCVGFQRGTFALGNLGFLDVSFFTDPLPV